ncbi:MULTISPECIES: LuxR C-terminal-related transcriptional regulator [Modestobacter]|jgi:DNA-binding NarL/FixJ family response regulator|uniref:LuxR family transcriptional regulator n=1 Tax=Modestobacter caceresii TaxID=1522368 RepID=A0A098Y2R6_9ACTN|nr:MULTISPECIES: response regulator transcription factor [Modestobacter]KGH45193.1 LuxR family transcriptional regulator [Modestobacter caceresii]MCZ2814339.1 response regulator transcription factor [Modestobacter sp. VKM Ac-2979]MCZ2843969.1 response regulator transcription factor [Modestobacter sp. VKM Ac-2980]MCZ2850647.1 response regulator transcription factor [Modestobacter sp. VKM Ac-2978]
MPQGQPWSDGVLFGPHASALVVDPFPLVREALAGRLRTLGARDVEEAASLEEARVRAHVSGPRALCVLEVDLPEVEPEAAGRGGDHGRGLELLPTLRTEGWPVTVVLTSVTDPAVVRAAFLAGVQGYLLKTSPLATVTGGLRASLSGEVFADPGIATSLARGLTRSGVEEAVGELSARERDILRLVADGHTNKEIGEKVDLSALTVKSHLARIARKLGTGDRAHMVALGLRSGVIE